MNNALFAQQSYEMSKSGNKDERINKINNHEDIKKSGFKAIKEKSGRDITYFENQKDKQVVIAHRGTDVTGAKANIDIGSDLSYAFGAEKHNKNFKKRTKETKKLMKNIDPSYHVTLTGHSLGGMTVNESLLNKSVRGSTDIAHTYNAGINPFGKPVSKPIKKELENKVIHHRTKNDIISKAEGPHGVTLTYDEKKKKIYKKIPKKHLNTFKTVDQLNSHGIKQFL